MRAQELQHGNLYNFKTKPLETMGSSLIQYNPRTMVQYNYCTVQYTVRVHSEHEDHFNLKQLPPSPSLSLSLSLSLSQPQGRAGGD